VVCPIGFVADHIEVVYDLDHELGEQAAQAGIALARAGTPNSDRRFARLAVDLIDELRLGLEPARVSGPAALPAEFRAPGCGHVVDGTPCAAAPNCVSVIATRTR
jgi:ferrochelatase